MLDMTFMVYEKKDNNTTRMTFEENWDIKIIGNDCSSTYAEFFLWREEDWEYVIKAKYKKQLVDFLKRDYPVVLSSVTDDVENKVDIMVYKTLFDDDIIILLSFKKIFNESLSYRKISDYLSIKKIPICESKYYW